MNELTLFVVRLYIPNITNRCIAVPSVGHVAKTCSRHCWSSLQCSPPTQSAAGTAQFAGTWQCHGSGLLSFSVGCQHRGAEQPRWAQWVPGCTQPFLLTMLMEELTWHLHSITRLHSELQQLVPAGLSLSVDSAAVWLRGQWRDDRRLWDSTHD